MSTSNVEKEGGPDKDHDDKETGNGNIVSVTVDGAEKRVRRGNYVVSEFKATVGVDAALALDEVIEGQFKELSDDAKLKIKGGEVFISHARSGASSHG